MEAINIANSKKLNLHLGSEDSISKTFKIKNI